MRVFALVVVAGALVGAPGAGAAPHLSAPKTTARAAEAAGLAGAARLTSPSLIDKAAGAATSKRAVVVMGGGGSTHAYTTPWAACASPELPFVLALRGAGLPTFTAPAILDGGLGPTTGTTGCPPPPPPPTYWNSLGSPGAAGAAVLEFLGWLTATYGYTTFDLVGFSYGGVVGRGAVAALKAAAAAPATAPGFSYAALAVKEGVTVASLTTLNTPQLRFCIFLLFFLLTEHAQRALATHHLLLPLTLSLSLSTSHHTAWAPPPTMSRPTRPPRTPPSRPPGAPSSPTFR
jgi:hypothetical protein